MRTLIALSLCVCLAGCGGPQHPVRDQATAIEMTAAGVKLAGLAVDTAAAQAVRGACPAGSDPECVDAWRDNEGHVWADVDTAFQQVRIALETWLDALKAGTDPAALLAVLAGAYAHLRELLAGLGVALPTLSA